MKSAGNAAYSTIFLNIKLFNNILHNLQVDISLPLNRLVAAFIHELVHIKQHSKQDNPWDNMSCRPLEYRSYIIDRKTFISVIKHLNAGIKTADTNMIHASSPQEIPARAHSFILRYISTVVTENPLTLKKSEESQQLLDTWIKLMDAKLIDPKYEIFNIPNTSKYKIYKRYMKSIYTELMSYKIFLINIRNNMSIKYSQSL